MAKDIETVKAVEAAMSPEERAELDAWERAGWEDLPLWTGPDLTKPDEA